MTPFTQAELRAFRENIAEEVARTQERVVALQRSFDDIVHSSEGSPPDDEHDPDGATSGFERAQIAALLASAQEQVVLLEGARARVDDGTYGTCASCGGAIGTERLLSLPSVRTCITCAGQRRPGKAVERDSTR